MLNWPQPVSELGLTGLCEREIWTSAASEWPPKCDLLSYISTLVPLYYAQ